MSTVFTRASGSRFHISAPGLLAVLLSLHCSVLAAEHPLDPLAKDEITTTVEVLKSNAKLGEKTILLKWVSRLDTC